MVDLKIGGLKFNEEFSPDTTTYTVTTTNATNTITAIPANGTAEIEIKVGEIGVTNGASAKWNEGSNTVTVNVVDGAQKKTYTVTVTKE